MERYPSVASTAASTEMPESEYSNKGRHRRRRAKSPPRRSQFRSNEGVVIIGKTAAGAATCDTLPALHLDAEQIKSSIGDVSEREDDDCLDAAVRSARVYWDRTSSALDAVEVSLPMFPK
mmetsp:Transcript_81024/g.160569  ORF Transcript_81024/g.160569 Transcript_81024/m.160569 type:complete len:120 (-) Transcript_81024:5-364(-)